MNAIQAYAAKEPGATLERFEYDPGELKPDEVEIEVDYCGICHSDLSMWQNDWGLSEYPIVPGHEVSGRIVEKGEFVTNLSVGQKVGLGWSTASCGTCAYCLGGNHNLCPDSEGTIVGRHGGFANRVRSQAIWATPLPDELDPVSAGPLFCGGITVFNPLLQNEIQPTDRVAVVGIGGLGHMAIQFFNKWGCEVTAFSTSPEKEDEVKALGAHHFINSKSDSEIEKAKDSFDLILVTVNVELDWSKYINSLARKGTLHFVGAAPKVESAVFPLIEQQKSITGSPTGSPLASLKMVNFAARHGIAPKTEMFPMSEVNDAMAKLEKESPAHRIVLQNDLD